MENDDDDDDNDSGALGGGRDAMDMDSRLGIRIVERQLSSMDLLDMMNAPFFVTTAALAAMSLKQLNRYLVDPAAVLTAAAVCGRTTLTTVGVVFEASKTRLTSNGNAFCKLNVGTLRAGGPCLTVLLFGAAYSSNITTQQQQLQSSNHGGRKQLRCTPGTVVAIQNPRLLPNNQSHNQDTALTVSINDPEQLLFVGRDRDLGQCQATVPGKNEHGHWISNAKRCPQLIDLRQGPCCAKHRNMGLAKHNSNQTNGTKTGRSSTGGGTLLQQLRQQPSQIAAATANNQNAPLLQGGNRRLTLPGGKMLVQPIRAGDVPSSLPSSSSQLKNTFHQLNPGHNTLLRQPNTMIVTPPDRQLHRRSQEGLAPSNRQPQQSNSLLSQPTNTRLVANPYKAPAVSKGQPSRAHVTLPRQINHNKATPTVTKTKPATTVDLHPLLLSESTSRGSKTAKKRTPLVTGVSLASSSITNKRRRGGAVNTDTDGFDGSVAVPKPSRMFQAKPQQIITGSATSMENKLGQQEQEQKQEHLVAQLLSRQAEVAAELLEGQPQQQGKKVATISKNPSSMRESKTCQRKNQPQKLTRGKNLHSLFGSLTRSDLDRAAQTTSRFASEVQAEEYAVHRRALVELENEEQRKAGSKNSAKKGNDASTNCGIQIEWHCRDCGKVYRKAPPVSCRRQSHALVRKRIVAAPIESVDQQRQMLNERSNLCGNNDGSLLTLGSGLEWSQWRGSRFS